MARRRRKGSINVAPMLPVLFAIGGLAVMINALSQIPVASIEGVVLFAAMTLAAIVIVRRRFKKCLDQKIADVVDANIEALVRHRAQLLLCDAYGTPQLAPWHKEIKRFFVSKVASCLTKREIAFLKGKDDGWISLIEDKVKAAADCDSAISEFDPKMTGPDFELFCAEELKRVGWEARVTKRSGDQGVDIIAQKKGLRAVLQCKRYNRPVGNHAVQEIATAKTHERAHFGAVVSNSRYTIHAQRLAKTSQIELLHFSDLKKIDAIISGRIH